MMPYARKYVMIFFMTNFHVEQFLYDKSRVKCFQAMKITKKNSVFLNKWHHVLHHLTKFELKIQFVRAEIKKRYYQGQIGLTRIVGGLHSLNFAQGVKWTM